MSQERKAYGPKQNSVSSTIGSQRRRERLTKTPGSGDPRSQVSENEIGYDDPLNGLDVLLSPENAARYLDVGRKFIYELIARKELEAERVGDRLRRIRLSSLQKWLNRPKGG